MRNTELVNTNAWNEARENRMRRVAAGGEAAMVHAMMRTPGLLLNKVGIATWSALLFALLAVSPKLTQADSRLDTYSSPAWMSELSDNTSLAAMSIPGTHESMSCYGGPAVQCQELFDDHDGRGGDSLRAQFAAGLRAIDIRVRMMDGEDSDLSFFTIHHGVVYQNANFDDVLREIRMFLTENPTETVLMRLGAECTGEGVLACSDASACSERGDCGATRIRAFRNYVDHYADLFWKPAVSGTSSAAVPQLGDVRGKLVLLSFMGPFGGHIAGYGLTQITRLSWTDGRNCYVEDGYDVPTTMDINDKWDRVHMNLDRANRATDCLDPSLPNGDKLYLSWANGASSGAYPATVAWGIANATGVNDFMLQCFNGENGRCDTAAIRRTGSVMMDFPSGELIDKIIHHNQLRGRCQWLSNRLGQWEDTLVSTKKQCESLNECSAGGACYRWIAEP